MNPTQFLTLLQWMDSAFPTGAFAHSGALETYAQSGHIRTADDLLRLVTVKLEAAAETDLIIVHCAMDAYHDGDLAQIDDLDQLCASSKVARETRQASEKVGRRMLDNVLRLLPDERLRAYREGLEYGGGHHAVVFGLACAALGVDAQTALLAFAYGLVSNQASVALKLLSMGQSQAQAVINAAQPTILTAVERALTRTLDDFGAFTPALDIRAMQHESLFRRLFIS
jgi:urease accessory protein